MTSNEVVQLMAGLGAMLAAALVLGRPLRWLGLPALLAEIAAGILLGPTILGAVAPDVHGWLFPAAGGAALGRDAIIKFGLVLFLVLAGLEVEIRHIAENRRAIALTSLLGMVIPFVVGYAAVAMRPGLWGVSGEGATTALVIATILSISALPVIARILIDNNLLGTRLGALVLSAATIDDLVGWALFGVILGRANAGGTEAGVGSESLPTTIFLVFGLFALIMAIGTNAGRFVLAWIRRRVGGSTSYLPVLFVVILVAAGAAERIGTHAIFGGFLVGVALSSTNEARRQLYDALRPVTLEILAPLYLVSIGLRANFATNFDLGLFGFVLAVATVGKVGGAALGARLAGSSGWEALTVGVAMNARGAMGIVLTTVALDYHLIDARVFVALTLMAVVTSALGAAVIPWIQRKGAENLSVDGSDPAYADGVVREVSNAR
jgi:Kef-type K+ transport system membrane component KefB